MSLRRESRSGDILYGGTVDQRITEWELADLYDRHTPIVNAYDLGELDKIEAERILAEITL
jgi:hypothetical protein